MSELRELTQLGNAGKKFNSLADSDVVEAIKAANSFVKDTELAFAKQNEQKIIQQRANNEKEEPDSSELTAEIRRAMGEEER